MSSHHIVREGQEPALLILGFDNFDDEQLGQLLEWSPMVLLAQSVYEKIASMGIKIDAIICTEKNEIYFQESSRFIYTQKRQTTLQAAMDFIVTQAYPAVNIISNAFAVNDFEAYLPLLDVVVFANNKKHYPIKNGFSKWEVSNTMIYVFGNITGHYGTKKIAEHTYITISDGFFGFSFEQNYLFIAQSL